MSKRQDEWMAKNEGGEYVQYYNPTGCVMFFTNDERGAAKTTDPVEADMWCRVAETVYNRTGAYNRMHIRLKSN